MDVLSGAELSRIRFETIEVGDRDHVGQLAAVDVGQQQTVAVSCAGHVGHGIVDREAIRLLDDEHVAQGAAVLIGEGKRVRAARQACLVVFH